MNVFVGRKTNGSYEITVDITEPRWGDFGFYKGENSIDVCATLFHKATSLRLRRGQIRKFDRVEFK